MKIPASGTPGQTSGDDLNSKSEQLVKKYMIAALAVGLVPFPLIDLVALTGIQLRMLSQLSKDYKVEFSEQLGTSAVGALLGSGGSTAASSASARFLLHLVPGAGWVAGIFTTSMFAGASTYAVGKVFIQHFASGGTFLTMDPEKVKAYYAQQLTRGAVEVKSFAGVKP